MGYYNSSKHSRQGYRNARMRRLRLQEVEAAAEEIIEGQEQEEEEFELGIEDGVNGTFHSANETQSALSSSSASSLSCTSAFSSFSPFLNTPPMRYSRRRRTIAGPRLVSKPDDFLAVQKSVRSGAPSPSPAREVVVPSSSSSTSPSPSLSHLETTSHSLSSASSPSPRLHPHTMTLPSAEKAMIAVPGRSQYSPRSRGRGRYLATSTARPARGREAAQQPTSQPIPWWRHWESVAVSLINVPLEANTFTIWQAFRQEGNIFSIDLFEDMHGNRETKGKIRFK